MNYRARQHEMCLCHVGVELCRLVMQLLHLQTHHNRIITESSDMHYLPFHLHPNPETNVRTHVSLNSPP